MQQNPAPLAPDNDPQNGTPRLTREGNGYTFWRDGCRYFVRRWAGIGGWTVTAWDEPEDGGERVEALAMDKKTRKAAIAEAVAKIDARRHITFHQGDFPSLELSAEAREHGPKILGAGFEVYSVGGGAFEMTWSGELLGRMEHCGGNRWNVWLHEGGAMHEIGRALGSIEAAALALRSEFLSFHP
ncbi:hypothetical protein AB0L54_32680 [Streptomyces sp. NPDC052196]|uniref:hypothetical protein n=1 Tax=Streptomyces sp. NPDC052196 TaxID=3156691 RepID=UPI00343B79EC